MSAVRHVGCVTGSTTGNRQYTQRAWSRDTNNNAHILKSTLWIEAIQIHTENTRTNLADKRQCTQVSIAQKQQTSAAEHAVRIQTTNVQREKQQTSPASMEAEN